MTDDLAARPVGRIRGVRVAAYACSWSRTVHACACTDTHSVVGETRQWEWLGVGGGGRANVWTGISWSSYVYLVSSSSAPAHTPTLVRARAHTPHPSPCARRNFCYHRHRRLSTCVSFLRVARRRNAPRWCSLNSLMNWITASVLSCATTHMHKMVRLVYSHVDDAG